MPDDAREAYRIFNENRLSRPQIKLDDEVVKTAWNNAKETFAEILEAHESSEILALGSGLASLEENYAFSEIMNLQGVKKTGYVPYNDKGYGDGFLVSDERNPNTAGCELLGFKKYSAKTIKTAIEKASVIIVLSEDILGRELINVDELNGKTLVYFGTNNNSTSEHAALCIPITCIAEHAASYVSVDGIVQRSFPAKETLYTSRSTNLEMNAGRLDRFGTKFDNWRSDKNRVDCYPFWEFATQLSERLDLNVEYHSSRDVFEKISKKVEPFQGISYEKMDEENGIQIATDKDLKTA